MEYTFRQLKAADIFPMTKIMSKIGISEIKKCFESNSVRESIKNNDLEAVGISFAFDFASIVCGNINKCESEIYSFLASVTELSVDEISNSSLVEFAELVVELIRKEEFKDFIGVVSKLFK